MSSVPGSVTERRREARSEHRQERPNRRTQREWWPQRQAARHDDARVGLLPRSAFSHLDTRVGRSAWDDRGSNSDALAGGRFSYHFGFRRPSAHACGSWSGLCLDPGGSPRWTPVGRARPVSTPSAGRRRRLGSALSAYRYAVRRESAEFERIPAGVSTRPAHESKSAVSAYSTIIPLLRSGSSTVAANASPEMLVRYARMADNRGGWP